MQKRKTGFAQFLIDEFDNKDRIISSCKRNDRCIILFIKTVCYTYSNAQESAILSRNIEDEIIAVLFGRHKTCND
jgi:hypothetical protein